jgi:hypothetical protein
MAFHAKVTFAEAKTEAGVIDSNEPNKMEPKTPRPNLLEKIILYILRGCSHKPCQRPRKRRFNFVANFWTWRPVAVTAGRLYFQSKNGGAQSQSQFSTRKFFLRNLFKTCRVSKKSNVENRIEAVASFFIRLKKLQTKFPAQSRRLICFRSVFWFAKTMVCTESFGPFL